MSTMVCAHGSLARQCLMCEIDAEVARLTAERDAALQRAEVAERNALRGQQRIATRCPSCGSQTLFIGAGGHLTCSLIGCKQPGVAGWCEQAKQRAEQAEAASAAKQFVIDMTLDEQARLRAEVAEVGTLRRALTTLEGTLAAEIANCRTLIDERDAALQRAEQAEAQVRAHRACLAIATPAAEALRVRAEQAEAALLEVAHATGFYVSAEGHNDEPAPTEVIVFGIKETERQLREAEAALAQAQADRDAEATNGRLMQDRLQRIIDAPPPALPPLPNTWVRENANPALGVFFRTHDCYVNYEGERPPTGQVCVHPVRGITVSADRIPPADLITVLRHAEAAHQRLRTDGTP